MQNPIKSVLATGKDDIRRRLARISRNIQDRVDARLDYDGRGFGNLLLEKVDPMGNILNRSQRLQLRKLRSKKDVMRLLHEDLGDTSDPNIMRAQAIFGGLVEMGVKINPMILSWKYYTMAQCINNIELVDRMFSKEAIRNSRDRTIAIRIRHESVLAMSQMVDKLAVIAGILKEAPERAHTPEDDDEDETEKTPKRTVGDF